MSTKKNLMDDEDYAPSASDSDTGSESDSLEEDDKELAAHEYEVTTLDGKVEVVAGTPLTAEEQQENDEAIDEAIANATREDPRFATVTERRLLRFACIMDFYKDEWKTVDQTVLDFSDNAPLRGIKGLKSKYIICKAGNFVNEGLSGSDGGPSKRWKLREMTAEEMASMSIDSTDSPCDCELCTTRRTNGFEKVEPKGGPNTKPKVGLRSGKKRQWDEKYGDGRTL